MAEFVRPFLYPKQNEAMFCLERIGVIEATTKSGKTVSAMAWLTEKTILGKSGQNFWWVSPGYNQSEIAFRRIKQGLTKGSFTAVESPVPKIHLMSGATMWFKSGDNADALYGEDVYAAVIDEASRVKEDCWYAIVSTLTATDGPVRVIGNVKGRKNWFYNLARQAEAEMAENADANTRFMHYAKITATDAVSAGILKDQTIEQARATMPENIFRELYFAEPSDDLGNPFGLENIRLCTVDNLANGPAVAYGIDLAKSQDFFVIIGLNSLGGVCEFHRWNGVSWRDSIKRVHRIVGEDAPTLVDSTGLGDPVLEELQYEHSNFKGYHFTSTSKQKLMEGLAVSIQGREITFPRGHIPLELEMFEYEFKPSGVKYSAPSGQHDDCVAALALARESWTTVAPGDNMMKFYDRVIDRNKSLEEHRRAESEARPWRDNADDLESIFANELKDIYDEGVKRTMPDSALRCFYCHEIIDGPSRATDGVNVWHVEHAGGMPKVVITADDVTKGQPHA